MIILITSLAFLSCFFLTGSFLEIIFDSVNRYKQIRTKKVDKMAEEIEDSFGLSEKKVMQIAYFLPFLFAFLLFILFKNILVVILGFLFGLSFPTIIDKFLYRQRLKKFRSQLVDTLTIMSSSLKAGLSFLQAIEVVYEEMPPPVSQEFKIILNENKWGISLDESLNRLRKRIPLEETNLLVTSILIAKESGGDLPKVLSRLITTIRNNLKLKEKITTLTLQGRLQGIIMTFLPIAFVYFIFRQNPDHFVEMWQYSQGRLLIMAAVVLQIVGMILIKRISTIKI